MTWRDILRCCLWCWCCGGTQEDSDTEEEPRRHRIKKKKRRNRVEPKQEADNTHGRKATFIKSDVGLDESEICKPPQEALVSKSALDEACEDHHVLLDEACEDHHVLLYEACEDHHVLLDEACEELRTEDSDKPSLDVSPYARLCEGSSPRPRIRRQTRMTAEQFTFLNVLGKGSHGKVFLAELKGHEDCFAVKAIEKYEVLKKNNVESIMVEKRVLALAWGNPFLTHLYSTFQTKEHLYFVMEYLTGGDLMFHLMKEGCFDLARATFYAAEIVCGLQFLHGKGIIHRDLKLENVLLDGDGHVKIADFGLCKENVSKNNLANSMCGTLDYMAPEILLGLQYSFSVDWWSFGVLLYGMLTGTLPFYGDDAFELYESIQYDTPDFPDWITLDTGALVEGLLEQDPSYRLGVVGNIRGQAFFRTIDWSALETRKIEPPYKPKVTSPNDCSNFDQVFLNEKPLLSQCEEGCVDSTDQCAFGGFSFTNQSMMPFLQQ